MLFDVIYITASDSDFGEAYNQVRSLLPSAIGQTKRDYDAGGGGDVDRLAGICVLFVVLSTDNPAFVLHGNGPELRVHGVDELGGNAHERLLLSGT